MVTDSQIDFAARLIRQGELVAFPTETVYGLGANAFDANAVVRIFEMKGRPRFDPLIVHIAGPEALPSLARQIPDCVGELMSRFWPGPLSLVLPKQPKVPDIVTAGLPSVAIRCPAHEVARSLIERAGVPIAAPSANRFGCVSPTTAAHVAEQFGDQLKVILDAGPCQVGVESTVLSLVDERPVLLRPGGVPLEDLEAILGKVEIAGTDDISPSSPGQLSRHYSPGTRLILTDHPVDFEPGQRVGLLALDASQPESGFAVVEYLSQNGCLREAAANLFAAMRRLDAAGLDFLVARPIPEVGLGRAIMDRLRRAAVSA